MKKLLFVSVFAFQLLSSFAQNYPASGDIYLGLRKLNVLGSVLYIAAHPDDENTRLITYFSKDRLYRTGYLSLTRGDGGQNLIGDEQGIELGLIRTQELLAARRIDGGEQFFTRAFDFGFSKTPEETFTKWDRDKILSDVVWVIRKFQPDVIITRFPTTGEGGHGHHTASAILANEAFTAAADPKRFPEQLKYVTTWQAKRILWNGFNFNNAAPSEGALKIDVGGYNPVLGKSYGEIAAESRSQHKSQGFGSSGNRGESYEFFRPTGGSTPAADLFEDVDVTWKKIGAASISRIVDSVTNAFDFLHPEASVKGLVRLYKAIEALPASQWKAKKLGEVASLVEACSGLYADATTTVPFTAQKDSVQFNFVLNNRLGADITLQKVTVNGFDSTMIKKLDKNRNLSFVKKIFVPASKPLTQPYWLINEMKEGYYNVSDQQSIGIPDVAPAYTATFVLRIDGVDFPIMRNVRYKYNDPVKGEVYQPFVIVPGVTLAPSPDFVVTTPEKGAFVDVRVKANVNIDLPDPKTISSLPKDGYKNAGFGSFAKGQEKSFQVLIGENYKGQMQRFYAGIPQDSFTKMRHQVDHDHIPTINYYTDAAVRVAHVDLKTAGKKIGYIVGAGDKVPEALEQMGYEVTMLTDKELSRNNLQQFDAIITGVRAYNTNEWLNNYYDKLMKYVENGGNLIVQYNTSNNIGPVRARIGPYNFEITRNRITDENAAVTFLHPNHQVLNYPNKITQEDFKGWIQERSIYHAGKRDTAFQSIFSMSDPNEQPDDGSLIISKYGKGFFSYTGVVFFRELPAGVPGAYRLLANLIALNHKKEF